MKTTALAFILLFICCLFSCLNVHYKHKPIPQPVTYTTINHSAFFNDKNILLTIDSVDHLVYFTLNIKGFKKFPFPINPQYKDTLTNTSFIFDFYYQGKPLLTDYIPLQNSAWETDSSRNIDHLSIYSDTTDLKSSGPINFQIPMYAFHNLKKGKQNIELNISQNVFTDDVEGGNESVHLRENKALLNARIKFDLNIPPVYKSIVYGYGLELRNDSAFSPAGMDNTLWNSSYPDIYWMIYYPTDTYYTKTVYEKSTDRYTAHDTFNLYHYYVNDSIGIGVYDHDYLSSDDGLGYWTGPLSRLSRHAVNRIKFGDVKFFDVKVQEKGVVN